MHGAVLAAGFGTSVKLSPQLLAALIPVAVLALALDAYCLIDLYRAPSVRSLPKIAWVLIILLIGWPLGPLIYLLVGRDRSQRAPPPAPPTAQPPATSPSATAPPATQPPATQPPATRPPATQPPAATTPAMPPAVGEPAIAPAAAAPPGSRPVVATTGLTRDYGGTGLFDVDLQVPHGCVYGLVGPNGAGKTTLLSILSGIRRADRGSVSWSIDRRQVAVCPDVPEFDGWLTGYEVVDLARSLVAPDAGQSEVLAALAQAGLADSAARRAGGYSRGMIQRLGLACALVGDPRLLILDEPTSALDPAGRAEILNLVSEMRGRRTVIFSSHILADVQRIADRIGILRGGRLLYQGGTTELIDTYLRPSWVVRIAGGAGEVAAALRAQPWAVRVELAGQDAVRVDADTIASGERGIPAAVAGCGARQISCEPVAADLESAFLALTGQPA
jgi:ABC-2 type transport system ATP-binding protein